MPAKVIQFAESSNSSRSQTVNIPNLKTVTSVTVNTGSVSHSVSGNDVTLNVSGGSATRVENSSYTPSEYVSTTQTSSSDSFPSSITVSQNGITGSIPKSGSSYVISGSPPSSDSKSVSQSSSATMTWRFSWTGSSWAFEDSWVSPSSISYSQDGYSGTLSYNSYNGSIPSYPSNSAGTGLPPGSTTTRSTSSTANYSGQVTKSTSDTRTWGQGYAGTIYGSTQYYSTSYYAYSVTVNYEEFQSPTSPELTYPIGNSVISSTPTVITWIEGADVETSIDELKYELEISLDGGVNWQDIVALTAPGVDSHPYDFWQHPDNTNVKIRIRTFDGTTYSPWNTTGAFSIVHKVKIGAYKIQTGNGTVEIPVYDPTVGMSNKNMLRMSIGVDKVGCFELVSVNDTGASRIFVKTNDGTKAIAKEI